MITLQAVREEVYQYLNTKFRHGWTAEQVKTYYQSLDNAMQAKEIKAIDRYFRVDCMGVDMYDIVEDNKFTMDKFAKKIYELKERMAERDLKADEYDKMAMQLAEDEGFTQFYLNI